MSMQRLNLALALGAALLASGCGTERPAAPWANFGGDPARGATVLTQASCGACHSIPGLVGANGMVGPPLTHFSRRTIIAGYLPNTPTNLVRWIRAPQSILPGNAMPDSTMTDAQARDAAAYLYSLR